MTKALPFLLLLLVSSLFLLSDAETTSLKPRAFESFNVSYIQNLGSCSYSVIITTSCSSRVYTRDHISLSFGDAYGNQVYVPRLDDPSTRTFERCSSDSFQISGPCAYQICYVYLYRSGPDGWKPETVRISGYNARDVSFYYNTFIPSDVWYGFDLCHSASSSQHQSVRRWFTYAILGFVLCALFFAYNVLRRFVPEEKVELVNGVALTADGRGAVFDVPVEDVDLYLAGQDNAANVSLEVVKTLPPFQEKEEVRGRFGGGGRGGFGRGGGGFSGRRNDRFSSGGGGRGGRRW